MYLEKYSFLVIRPISVLTNKCYNSRLWICMLLWFHNSFKGDLVVEFNSVVNGEISVKTYSSIFTKTKKTILKWNKIIIDPLWNLR